MNRKTLAALIAAAGIGAAAFFFWPKKAKAETRPPLPPQPPQPEPPPALPPAPASKGDPTTTEYWAQPPPPGRDTVGPTTPIASGQGYVLKGGETLSNIAERTYGNYRWWPYLWDLNKEAYPNPDKTYPGNKVQIPAASTLPMEKQDYYFQRSEEHRQLWSLWKKAGLFGKKFPKYTPFIAGVAGTSKSSAVQLAKFVNEQKK